LASKRRSAERHVLSALFKVDGRDARYEECVEYEHRHKLEDQLNRVSALQMASEQCELQCPVRRALSVCAEVRHFNYRSMKYSAIHDHDICTYIHFDKYLRVKNVCYLREERIERESNAELKYSLLLAIELGARSSKTVQKYR